MGNTLGGATCILTCTSHSGSEFSEKVVRTTLTFKTQLVIQHNPLFWWVDRGSMWTSFSPQILSESVPTFSTRNIFITISWDFSHHSERYWTAIFNF